MERKEIVLPMDIASNVMMPSLESPNHHQSTEEKVEMTSTPEITRQALSDALDDNDLMELLRLKVNEAYDTAVLAIESLDTNLADAGRSLEKAMSKMDDIQTKLRSR